MVKTFVDEFEAFRPPNVGVEELPPSPRRVLVKSFYHSFQRLPNVTPYS